MFISLESHINEYKNLIGYGVYCNAYTIDSNNNIIKCNGSIELNEVIHPYLSFNFSNDIMITDIYINESNENIWFLTKDEAVEYLKDLLNKKIIELTEELDAFK